MMNKYVKLLVKLILAYLTTVSMAMVTGYGITGIEIILPCLFALAMIVYELADRKIAAGLLGDNKEQALLKRNLISSAIVGIIFSISVVVGAHIDVWDEIIISFSVRDIFYFIVLSIFFAACIFILFTYIDSKKNNDKDKLDKKDTKESKNGIFSFLPMILILIICWMPYYLTMFPGNLGKDTFESIDMCLGRIPWSNHHPIFFTALINLVFKATSFLNSYTASMAIFTFLHMLVLAATLSYLICKIKNQVLKSNTYGDNQGRMRLICTLTLIFFALNPIVAMFSIYISKDVLFSCAVIMFTLKLFDVSKEFKKNDGLLLGLYSLFVMLLRNNGLMIVAVVALVLLIVYRKQWKLILSTALIPIMVFMIFKSVSYKALKIMPESFAEAASIPLQQVGYVIAKAEGRDFSKARNDSELLEENLDYLDLSDDEIAILNNIMPLYKVREVYELGYTDSYKFAPDFNDEYFNDNRLEFMNIWFKMLPGHLGDYTVAYLAQTAGYWHYGESNTLCTQGVWEDNEINVVRIDLIEKVTGISLYAIIEKLMLFMRKAPLVCILTSMAMEFYGLLLAIAALVRIKQGKYIIGLLPNLVLWVSIMIATPAFCLFRYTYPMYLLWPVTILLCLEGEA